MARTRMQAALPATVALRLDAWRRPLGQHLIRADALQVELSEVQIGGPIGARDLGDDPVKACAEAAAIILGLSLGSVWHSDRSRVVSFGHWMVLVAGTLGKIGQDVALMAQQGLDEVSLSGGGGSSAMAHKQNPIAAEAMVTLARYVAGQQGILGQAMIHEQERSGAAWALEWLTLPAMAEATGAALCHAEKLIASIERMGASKDLDL
jgi:3-carboxy-cis,cis-muconate cycloisomerase